MKYLITAAISAGIVLSLAPPASAATARCTVVGSRTVSSTLSEVATYYDSINDWDVVLQGQRTVAYAVKCRRKGRSATIKQIVTEPAYGADTVATGRAEALEEARAAALTPARARGEKYSVVL